MAESAQETYRRFLRDHIAPAFRELGLRGSGNRYLLPDDTYWIEIGFQGSRHSDRDSVRFTMNMGFADKAEWHEFRSTWPRVPARPSPSVAYPVGLSWRVAPIATGEDTWWEIRAGQPLERLATELVNIVRDTALPWLRHHIEDPAYYQNQAPPLR